VPFGSIIIVAASPIVPSALRHVGARLDLAEVVVLFTGLLFLRRGLRH
jgi:hypothetical protein